MKTQRTCLGLILCFAVAGCSSDNPSKNASDAGNSTGGMSNDAGNHSGGSTGGHQGQVDAAINADAQSDATAMTDGATTDASALDAGATDAGTDAGAMGDAGGVALFGSGDVAIVYSAEGAGVDIRTKIVSALDGNGTLESYTARLANGMLSTMESPTRGTCMATDLFVDSTAALGRLYGGDLGGAFYGNTLTFGAKEGFHYVVGLMDAALPASGNIDFATLAASSPTIKGGTANPGTSTGTATVDFTDKKVAVDLTVTIGGDTYTLTTTGGTATPSTSEIDLDTDPNMRPGTFGGVLALSNTGAACTGASCIAYVQGTVLGNDEERLAVTVAITGNGNGGDGVHGVIVMQK